VISLNGQRGSASALEFLIVDEFLKNLVDARALKTAFELGLVDRLVEHRSGSSEALGRAVGTDRQGMRFLLDLLRANGVVEERSGDVRLTRRFQLALRYRDLLETKLDYAGFTIIVRDKLDNERANLAVARERMAELVVHARTDGIFVVPQTADMPGRYYKKGDLLGYVIGRAHPLARVVVPQEAIDEVRLGTDDVRVRLSENPETALQGRVVREVPAGDATLPSPALSAQSGGAIATDPRETKTSKALQRFFQFDVELEDADRIDHFGQRLFVRFEHRMEPLAVQWYRSIRLLFLTAFNV